MSLFSGKEDEYKRRHDPIWEELELVLRNHGVRNYSIFLEADSKILFGYAEIEDEAAWEAIASTDICQKWWAYMKDLMPVEKDNRPVSHELREVFHLRPAVPENR